MLFETEGSAEKFLKYNSNEIDEENGKAPVRSYYCPYCLGWHVTSNPNVEYFQTHKLENEERIDAIVEENMKKAEEKKMKFFNMAKEAFDNGQYDCAVDAYLQAFYRFKNTESLTAEKMLDSAFDTEIILLQNICNGSWKGFDNKNYSIDRFQERLEKASIGLEQRYESKKADIKKYLKELENTEKQKKEDGSLELQYLNRIEKVEQTMSRIDVYIRIGQNSEARRLINECANLIKNILNNYSPVVEKDKLVKMVDQLILLRQQVEQIC